MRLAFNEDQATFSTVLGQMLGDEVEAGFHTVEGWGRYDYGHALDARLEEAGFFDAAREEDLGTVAAAAMVHDVARVPVVIECAASALLRPFLGDDLPRPLAVVVDDAPGAIRFLPQARALVSITPDAVRLARLDGQAEPVESLYAYPMGVAGQDLDWQPLDADPQTIRTLWQIALAAELGGVLDGGLASVLRYVREREQFGRPIGSFQGVQHRLATDAVWIDGARLLTLRAASTRDPAHAALALAHIQSHATRIGYDLHQFMGAMGLTLEHPLHRWTYRARALRAEMGGAPQAFLDYADTRWGKP
ncbi:acyl-CoA dehydrogenase family protein [Maritimibacter sp. UBA3975]|uniref:acyl-CoA dehydrogenase family protein n=1 Tax=Maritimibacter sp. UBA3975 TaxID=1946833 RepID=UPI000C08DC0D|nr:acyl-CoA dehydrogenase family protein [Maritimibacter sp. UBA3975]MAM62196.1 acyl-CoA dehydrogenase [Maritimibacter sp.]|tara:strand:+ start:54634 stop:55551 length:918 start_codon:yes stop_codon:yes gene_type:complete